MCRPCGFTEAGRFDSKTPGFNLEGMSKGMLAIFVAVAAMLTGIATAEAVPTSYTRPRVSVPELNGEVAASAVALVAGGIAIVLGRRKRANKA